MCRVSSGLHAYGAWYHLIGELVTSAPRDTFIEFGSGMRGWFHSAPALVPGELAGQPIVQLEIECELPWLLAEAELE